MKVLRWEETEHHYIAVVRPDELFDLSTLTSLDPADREVHMEARNIVTGKMSIYAYAYGKGYNKDFVKKCVDKIPDIYSESDVEYLRQRDQHQRRTA